MKLLEGLCPLYQKITVAARVRMGLFLSDCYFNGKVICQTRFRISGDVNRSKKIKPPPPKKNIVCRTQFRISEDVNRISLTPQTISIFLYKCICTLLDAGFL